jgi:hypothetical protein
MIGAKFSVLAQDEETYYKCLFNVQLILGLTFRQGFNKYNTKGDSMIVYFNFQGHSPTVQIHRIVKKNKNLALLLK